MGTDIEVTHLLESARLRGAESIAGIAMPAGLDHLTVYLGLVGSALELGKLIKTEKRDLAVINSHYELESARIRGAFAEVEAAMLADFRRDESLKDKTFEAITMLITAGQFELASEFHKRFMDSLNRSSLETVIESRNMMASQSKSALRLK